MFKPNGRLMASSTARSLFALAGAVPLVALCGSGCSDRAGDDAPTELGTSQAALQNTVGSPRTLALRFELEGETYRLDLERSSAPTTTAYQSFTLGSDGRLVARAPSLSGCLYRGRVERVSGTGEPGWAVVDACAGSGDRPAGEAVSGMLRAGGGFWQLAPTAQSDAGEGQVSHSLERLQRLDTPDVVFAEPRRTTLELEPESVAPLLEFKEGTNAETKYIDLIVVSDAARATRLGGQTESLAVQFVAAMNALLEESRLEPRVRVTLRAHVQFETDPYPLVTSGNEVDHDALLEDFLDWAQAEDELPDHDEHLLLSGLNFLGATAGYAGLGVACTTGLNGFIVQAADGSGGFPVLSAVHELGHTLGMDHDSTGNPCPQQGFIMAAVGCGNCPIDGAEFSSCSQQAFTSFLDGPSYAEGGFCGDDVPSSPGVASCGDGVVSGGEECDCGADDCAGIDPCCDGSSCQLEAGAECSDYNDSCCQSCQIVSEQVVCRAQRSSCDIAETCTGVSKDCPLDTFLPAGGGCQDERGNSGACYFGECRTRGTQCELIAEQQIAVGGTNFENVGAPGQNCDNPCNAVICGLEPNGCITINGPTVTDGVPCDGAGQCVNEQCVSLVDQCPNDDAKVDPGQCGCGRQDADGDDDGTADCRDGCPGNADKLSPGQCGCDAPDVDTDSDGTFDCVDACTEDASKTDPGQCGCGTADADRDGDGIADCSDSRPDDPNVQVDADGDGTLDCEDDCPQSPGASPPSVTAMNDGTEQGGTRASVSASGGCSIAGGSPSLSATRAQAAHESSSHAPLRSSSSLAWLALAGIPLFRRRSRGRAQRSAKCVARDARE